LVAGVEDQRVLSEAQGVAVAEPTKRHAFNHVLVLDEDREQPSISVRLGQVRFVHIIKNLDLAERMAPASSRD